MVRTLAIDLTAPTAPTYTPPTSLKVGEAITAMNPSGGTGIAGYAAEGLPSGLAINNSTGAITGTPDAADANPSTATVTVTDTAGNTAEVSITFPVVSKGVQTLAGFQYSAATMTFGTTVPSVTAPTGAQTTVRYSADPPEVCTVNAATGELTIIGLGNCVVTATAEASDDYEQGVATFTVAVQSAGNLVLNLDAIADDNTVNIAEKAAGFAIAGDTGSEEGVDVSVQIGSETPLTDTSADDGNGAATWSVDVPSDAAYIAGSSVTVTVSASKTGYTDPADVVRTLAIDLTAPTAPTYTPPISLTVGEAIATMNPSGGTDIAGYSATGLPSGLEIDDSSGAITGTPDTADANTSTATVTVTDTAGNTASVNISFPSVDAPVALSDDATLSGLSLAGGGTAIALNETFTSGTTTYTAEVPYTTNSITVTPAKSDGKATIEYLDEDDSTITDTDANTEALDTSLTVGENVIKIKVTAEDGVSEETYTVTVTVQPALGNLVMNVNDHRGRRHRKHRGEGGRIHHRGRHRERDRRVGDRRPGQHGTEPPPPPPTTTATPPGRWTCRPDASYITGASLAVTVSAFKTGYAAPADVDRTLAIEPTRIRPMWSER